MDTGSSKMSLLNSRNLDLQDEGCAVDIAHVDPGINFWVHLVKILSFWNNVLIIKFLACQSVLVYATMYGSIIGWDLRASGNAWKIENNWRQGKTGRRIISKIGDELETQQKIFFQVWWRLCVWIHFRIAWS